MIFLDNFNNSEITFFIDHQGYLWSFSDSYFDCLGLGPENYLNDKYAASGPHKCIFDSDNTPCIVDVICHHGISLALDDMGSLWGCGNNYCYGQLGLGDYINRKVFTKVCENKNVTLKSAIVERDRIYIFDINGFLWCCGNNEYGHLGVDVGKKCNTLIPLKLPNQKNIHLIKAFNDVTFFLDEGGNIWFCGTNSIQYRDHTFGNLINISPNNVKFVTFEVSHREKNLHAIDINGNLWGIGNNKYGILGLNHVQPNTIFSRVATENNIKVTYIKTIKKNLFVLDNKHNLWACGRNIDSLISKNFAVNDDVPILIKLKDNVYNVHICESEFQEEWGDPVSLSFFLVVLDQSGYLWFYGNNFCGDMNHSWTKKFYKHNMSVKFISTFICESSLYAFDDNYNLWVMGKNSRGQLGLPTNHKECETNLTRLDVNDTKFDPENLYFQYDTLFLLDLDGNIWVCGDNKFRTLGTGSNSSYITPLTKLNINNIFISIKQNESYTIAFDKYGYVWINKPSHNKFEQVPGLIINTSTIPSMKSSNF